MTVKKKKTPTKVTRTFRLDKKVVDTLTCMAEEENRTVNNMLETVLLKKLVM